jgi:hypothetical protein
MCKLDTSKRSLPLVNFSGLEKNPAENLQTKP